MISVQDMMNQMRALGANRRPRPFSIQYCTADRQKKTGGQIREISRGMLITAKRQSNRLLNIQPIGTKDIIRVHMDLILYFNGIPVL